MIKAGSFTTGAGVYSVSATGNAVINGNALSQTTSTSGPGLVGAGLLTSTVDAGVVNSGAGVVSIAGFAIPVVPGLPAISGGVISLAGGNAVANAHGNITTTGNFGVLALSLNGNATATSDEGITVDPPIGMGSVVVAGSGQAHVINNATQNTTLVGLLGVNIGTGSVLIDNNSTGVVNATTGVGILAVKTGATGTVDPAIKINNSGSVIASAWFGGIRGWAWHSGRPGQRRDQQ